MHVKKVNKIINKLKKQSKGKWECPGVVEGVRAHVSVVFLTRSRLLQYRAVPEFSSEQTKPVLCTFKYFYLTVTNVN